jgi:hypothetical protein
MIGRIKTAGGQAEMLAPPDRGIRGNSHMIMQDKNNLPIADLILRWIDERVSKRSASTVSPGPSQPVSQPPARPSGPLQQKLAPGLATLTDDLHFGDVWRRPEPSPRDRSLVTISVLIATGLAEGDQGDHGDHQVARRIDRLPGAATSAMMVL